MPDSEIVKCKHCGGDIAFPKGSSDSVSYHKNCEWYELPCSICGKPMQIHRDWENPPRAHKACKESEKSKYYTIPCEYCGEPLGVRLNAVKIPRFHKKCAAKAQNAILPADTSEQRRLRVFLCHSSSDKPKIRELYQWLRRDGFIPWLDEEELLPGQDWKHEISKAVRASDVVLACLSNKSVSKIGYVQKEIKHALDIADEQAEGAIFLIPLKLEKCNVPDRLKRWHWVNLFEPGGYEKLVLSLRKRDADLM